MPFLYLLLFLHLPISSTSATSCETDLGGVGSFTTTCILTTTLVLDTSIHVTAPGSLLLTPTASLLCPIPSCEITFHLGGSITIRNTARIEAGTVGMEAGEVRIESMAVVNASGLGGAPPERTSGVPSGDGGGGYGGRGARCVGGGGDWGGDEYGWSELMFPRSYGSKGGSVSRVVDFGGGGGGRVWVIGRDVVEVWGTVGADGGDGGLHGGGGSGGSVFVSAPNLKGSGVISASGGNGIAGGGGGRVSINVTNKDHELRIFVHGGRSSLCPYNNGAAGTLYDAYPHSLTIDNYNLSTMTDTLLMEFPNRPLWANIFVQNNAKVVVPLLWSRVQVQGRLAISNGSILSFGLIGYPVSEFELISEELLVSDSLIRVFGALRMSTKMLLMLNSAIKIEAGPDEIVATSLLEASNLFILKGASIIRSNCNLGVYGQGLLQLSGPGDLIEAQRLILSLFYSIHVGPGSLLSGPLQDVRGDDILTSKAPSLYCEESNCPVELIHPPEDCNLNSSLSFTLQICRVEDIHVEGIIKGNVIHFHRARSVIVRSSGTISASGLGCRGGIGQGKIIGNGLGGGGGHGGIGGDGVYDGNVVEGGNTYGDPYLPCELGSGSGNDSFGDSTAGGGVIVMGSLEHPLLSLSVYGSIEANGESNGYTTQMLPDVSRNSSGGGIGGGSGGTILLFLQSFTLDETSVVSSTGGHGSPVGGGGGGGGRIHFHWSYIPSRDEYFPIANAKGNLTIRGGLGQGHGFSGGEGHITAKTCPKGLFGVFCQECPLGTFKNVSGSDKSLCLSCPPHQFPDRAIYTSVRGGVTETPCPYKCINSRYHMPHCYTTIEELIYTFGGPLMFCCLLIILLFLVALVLSVARMKFVHMDDLPGPAPTQHGSEVDHSFPFLESLNEVLETNRNEESKSHVHRMYFSGPNTFSEPWHLSHSPPHQISAIVYEDAYNLFVDELNNLASYQWWEGAIYIISCIFAYPLACLWQRTRRSEKYRCLRKFVHSEYDHSCLRSCRSRALYEGLKVAATADFMVGYVDFSLGGDQMISHMPPQLHQRFPLYLVFGGDGSYISPFALCSDNVLTSLMSQAVPPTIWYRVVAGLNAQLRLVRCGQLNSKFLPVINWIDSHANPALGDFGVVISLARFPATASGYFQFGITVFGVQQGYATSGSDTLSRTSDFEQILGTNDTTKRESSSSHLSNYAVATTCQISSIQFIDTDTLCLVEDRKEFYNPVSGMLHNTKPIGHQELIGLLMSVLLLGDFVMMMLTTVQLYSFSPWDVVLTLFVLPLGVLAPFLSGISALFTQGPKTSAEGSRLYALWNAVSLVNAVVALTCSYVHFINQSSHKHQWSSFLSRSWMLDEGGWWVLPTCWVMCKCIQSRIVNLHIANSQIKDYTLYSNDPDKFWRL